MIENLWLWIKFLFLFPLVSLLPRPCPYLLTRYLSRVDCWCNPARKRLIETEMARLLDKPRLDGGELALAVRRYFEVISCDQVDRFIYTFGWRKSFTRGLKVEGLENLKEALSGRGGILLTAHFGGGFWLLPFLKELGVRVRFFSIDIERQRYPHQLPLFLYHRLSNWVVEKASGGKVLYKSERKKGMIEALREDRWVIVLFDVPPSLVREKMEVSFLGKKTWFPKGVISVGKEVDLPIVPFFAYLDDGNFRRVCFEKPIYVKNEEESVDTCVKLIERRIIERPDHWHLWPAAGAFFGQ